eukprot:CFRG5315T1
MPPKAQKRPRKKVKEDEASTAADDTVSLSSNDEAETKSTTIDLVIDKTVKHSVRFKEISNDPILGTVYVKKKFCGTHKKCKIVIEFLD